MIYMHAHTTVLRQPPSMCCVIHLWKSAAKHRLQWYASKDSNRVNFVTFLNIDTPPLWISTALNDVGGSASAVHRKALIMDLCVMTRWLLPGASSISAESNYCHTHMCWTWHSCLPPDNSCFKIHQCKYCIFMSMHSACSCMLLAAAVWTIVAVQSADEHTAYLKVDNLLSAV